MKKLATFVLSLSMVISLGGQAFASNNSQEAAADEITSSTATKDQTVAPAAYGPVYSLSAISPTENKDAKTQESNIVSQITDPAAIQALVDSGQVEADNGKLPDSITTYVFKDSTSTDIASPKTNSTLATGISVTKTDYYDGRYFDDYDRYQIDGPADFSTSYSKTGTYNWNTSLTGSVEVGGKVYGVVDVKAAVSSTVGYSFGGSDTKTQTYSVKIPDKKYWVIKVWVSYLVYEYTAKVGSVTITTGKTWKPNGLVIEKTEYSK